MWRPPHSDQTSDGEAELEEEVADAEFALRAFSLHVLARHVENLIVCCCREVFDNAFGCRLGFSSACDGRFD